MTVHELKESLVNVPDWYRVHINGYEAQEAGVGKALNMNCFLIGVDEDAIQQDACDNCDCIDPDDCIYYDDYEARLRRIRDRLLKSGVSKEVVEEALDV